jgi:hypothetical protein
MPQTCCLALLPLQVVHWVCDRVACAVAYVQGVLPDGAMFTDVPLGACGASAAEVECAMFRLFYDVRPSMQGYASPEARAEQWFFVCLLGLILVVACAVAARRRATSGRLHSCIICSRAASS